MIMNNERFYYHRSFFFEDLPDKMLLSQHIRDYMFYQGHSSTSCGTTPLLVVDLLRFVFSGIFLLFVVSLGLVFFKKLFCIS